MAERFNGDKEESAWFMKNRSYVDDAMGGTNNKEGAKKISRDMEDMIENGVFCFKETVLTGASW
jgi:hypothetical protein